MESVMSTVGGLEKRLDSVERFMDEVRSNMDRTFVEVQQVGKRAKDDLQGIVDLERRTEGKVSELALNLDVERICLGVADARKVMEEAVEVIGSARRVERMEVEDTDEELGGSYAQVLRRRRRRQKGPTVVLEGPVGGDVQITREQVVKCLDPKKGDVRVKGLRRKGRDFVIEVHGEEDLEKLRQNKALDDIGLKVDGAAKLKWPRMYVHDVDREIEREELVDAIRKRNPEVLAGIDEENLRQGFIPEFIRGRRDHPVRSWVVRVSPELYKRLMRVGRVYIGVRSCRVMEFDAVTRCYRCQGLGHIRKYCRDEERCGHCAGKHDLSKCEKKDQAPSCVNCQRLGMRERQHPAMWRECPSVVVFRRRAENMTDYG